MLKKYSGINLENNDTITRSGLKRPSNWWAGISVLGSRLFVGQSVVWSFDPVIKHGQNNTKQNKEITNNKKRFPKN